MVKRRSLLSAALGALGLGGVMTVPGAMPLPPLTAPSGRVAGQAQPVDYRQGVITKWNPVDLSNEVLVGGTTFTNLPVLGVAEAASYKLGSVVGLHCVGNSWAIVGLFAVPGTTAATDAVTDTSKRIVNAFVAAGEDTTSLTFTDLATFGPQVTIPIGASGQALVIIGADLQVNNDGALMGYDVSGANTISASANNCLFLRTTAVAIVRNQFSLVDPLVGLTPGLTTFTAKYAISTNAGSRLFSRRRLTVVAF